MVGGVGLPSLEWLETSSLRIRVGKNKTSWPLRMDPRGSAFVNGLRKRISGCWKGFGLFDSR